MLWDMESPLKKDLKLRRLQGKDRFIDIKCENMVGREYYK